MALTKVSYSMIQGASVNVLDYGAVGDGTTDDKAAIQSAINSGYTVYFPKGTYKVASVISVPTGMRLYANKDATILSTITTVPSSYQEIFVATTAVSNISVQGLKFQTSQVAFAAFGFQKLVTNLDLLDNECQGCSLVTTFEGAANALIEGNYIHSPAHEGVMNDYARAIQISSGFTGTGTSNVNISNNIILGSWTHGIEVFGGDVMTSLDPTAAKNVNGVVVQGNIVKAVSSAYSAGAIWFSQAANVSVVGNHCELYGDVGIDFEACTNAVASGNTLRNNNKNLAMYGNSLTVLFTGNTCYNTVAGLSMFYAKPANNNGVDYQVDARNTDITLEGNKFYNAATPTGFERLEMGSGGVITVSDNTLTNCTINATYMSLTEIVIKNNKITHNDFAVGMVPIHVQQSYANGDATTTPFAAFIGENVITHANPATSAQSILYQLGTTTGASIDFDYYADIIDNEIRCNSSKDAIYVQVSGTITGTKYLYHTLQRNKAWGAITYNLGGNRTVVKNPAYNLAQTSALYSTTRTTAGALNTWDLSYLDTAAASGIVYTSLADGDYNGQQKQILMSAKGTYDGVVIIAHHRLGVNQNATFSATGQFALLEWNINAWDTIKATCAGI
jgi:parallel beta-helix repeat protein